MSIFQGYQLLGYIDTGEAGRQPDGGNSKELMDYTFGNIADKGNYWLSNRAPNVTVMYQKEDMFDRGLKAKNKTITIAVSSLQMKIRPYKEKDAFHAYHIIWNKRDWNRQEESQLFKRIVFYQVTVEKITSRDYSKTFAPLSPISIITAPATSYVEIVMKIGADVDYKDY